VGLSKTNWPAGSGAGATKGVGVVVGGIDVEVRVSVGRGAGEGEPVGVLAGVRVAVRDGAGPVIAMVVRVVVGGRVSSDFSGSNRMVIRVLFEAGVDVGSDAVEGAAVGVVAGIRIATGDGAGMAVEVGVSNQSFSNPCSGVNVSTAWAVAIRICIALFLLITCIPKNTNSTTATIADTAKPPRTMSRVLSFILNFSYFAIPGPRLV
jgi:hypothetical protein